MPIETEIKGSPSSIRSAGTWLRDTLGPAVDGGVDAMNGARQLAASDWLGDTGQSFSAAMSRGSHQVDEVREAATHVGRCFDDYAGSLASCQSRMAGIRGDASAAGLTLSGTVIEDPGAGPGRPSTPPPADAPAATVGSDDADVAAYDAHQDLITAYQGLVGRADEVWTDVERAWERVSVKDRALDGASWVFSLSDVAGGLGGSVAEVQSSALRTTSQYFKELGDDYLARLAEQARNGTIPDAAKYYDDLDHYTRMAGAADDGLSQASRLARLGKAAPVALGGLLAAGGAFYDWKYGGESAEQAVASNAGGFAASIATGALVGTAIGGPVGTVVGVVVGAGVGVFTSGMIDGLFENGGDVSDALVAGADTVVDTGAALVDVGGSIVDGIGGLFD
ncbi:MAG: hypothetical protein LH468_12375 [Nocardioides sp.]|nr:hypothetical protein [Nocardioides sp.]